MMKPLWVSASVASVAFAALVWACGSTVQDGHVVGLGESCGGYTRYEDRRTCGRGLTCCGEGVPADSSGKCVNESDPQSCERDTTDAGPDAAVADATVPGVNGCSAADFAANDRTADDAERILRGPDGPAPAQFSPHCMRVRVGQTVAWTADLTSHSMSYVLVSTVDGGFGDAATTFVLGGDGGHTEDTAQASEPMTISFTCSKHPTLMFGAVEVVP